MIDKSKEAVLEAKVIHKRVSEKISALLGLYEEAMPEFMEEVGDFLAAGYVNFDIELSRFLSPEKVEKIEKAIERSVHPLTQAAGWVMKTPEDVYLILDEMWVDPAAHHAMMLLEGGMYSIIVSEPGTGILALRVDATEMFMRQGWRIVPQAMFEQRQEQAYEKYREAVS